MEEALRESERAYRELVENLNDLVFKMDIQGVITYISPQVEAMFGDRPSEVIGRHYVDFVHAEDRPSLAKSLQDALENRLYPSVFRVRTRRGTSRVRAP